MELVTEPDIYQPSVDVFGNYTDKMQSFHLYPHGLYCPCGSRKDKLYMSNTIFSKHMKSKTHNKWLDNLNTNKSNFYIESEKLKEVVSNQQHIISRMEKEISNKSLTIDYLTQQLTNITKKNDTTTDLLNFD